MDGFVGGQCQVNVNECALKQPCLHGGSCFDLINDYLCICTDEFTVSHLTPTVLSNMLS